MLKIQSSNWRHLASIYNFIGIKIDLSLYKGGKRGRIANLHSTGKRLRGQLHY